jgi:RNA polymerase sigma-70 factor, ECF subfamily
MHTKKRGRGSAAAGEKAYIMHRSERKLVQAILAGDKSAAEGFALRFRPDLFNLFVWLTHDPELAENLTQETFLQVWEHLRQFRGESSLRRWIHTIAFSILAQQRRRERTEYRNLEKYAQETTLQGTEARRQAEMRLALAQALEELPEAERRVIVLCKLQGFTLAEAAGILNEPAGTLAWRVAEGLKKLRALLSEENAPASLQTGTPCLAKEDADHV